MSTTIRSIIIHPNTKEQEKLLELLARLLGAAFVLSEGSYNPEFLKKIDPEITVTEAEPVNETTLALGTIENRWN